VLTAQFTLESGHLTPSLKLKRAAVVRDFEGEIARLYG
jgi:long-chain acyl-CoA synthetase